MLAVDINAKPEQGGLQWENQPVFFTQYGLIVLLLRPYF